MPSERSLNWWAMRECSEARTSIRMRKGRRIVRRMGHRNVKRTNTNLRKRVKKCAQDSLREYSVQECKEAAFWPQVLAFCLYVLPRYESNQFQAAVFQCDCSNTEIASSAKSQVVPNRGAWARRAIQAELGQGQSLRTEQHNYPWGKFFVVSSSMFASGHSIG
ncbi:hypothetical protein CLIB1423_13S00562 [[Candida] railenensis]|uniref:Uncharacterized protein n=1 Tax=[Candida] railenensis TaxID=45579 RepID=A0A9P0QQX2_9ASCO|nr:hypothetical protein CLIB1423_13S00562 [[Candida] railenensis]